MTMRPSALPCRIAAIAALLGISSAHAAGTPDPGDYVPAPAGTTVVALYAQHLSADKTYADSRKVGNGLGLKLDIGVARLMRYFEIAGKPADVEVILPYARQRISSLDYRESGVGNVQVGATFWPMADEQQGRWWGLAAYLTAPTGQKRAQGLAVSEDRWALSLESGHIFELGEYLGGRWSLDLIGQTEFYSRDDSSDASRRPLLRGFAHLSWQPSPVTRLAVSLRQSWGSREHLAGLTTLGAKKDTNLMLTWAHQFTDSVQLQLQWAQDVKVRNGDAIRALQARTVFAF